MKVDNRFNLDSFLSGVSAESGSNEIALAIAEMSDSNYIEKIAVMNADINTIADLEDNTEHQKSIETLLLDQRRQLVQFQLMKKLQI